MKKLVIAFALLFASTVYANDGGCQREDDEPLYYDGQEISRQCTCPIGQGEISWTSCVQPPSGTNDCTKWWCEVKVVADGTIVRKKCR